MVLTSGSVGLFLIEVDFRNQLKQARSELISVRESIESSQVDKVTVALALVSASQSDTSLFLAEDKSEVIPLAFRSNDVIQLRAARKLVSGQIDSKSREVIAEKVAIEGDLILIVTTSISHLYDERRSELLRFLLFLLFASTLALAILRKVINQDVERESQEWQLREQLRNEEARRKLLLEFASDASHELRTPLTVIMGYLDLLAKHQSESIEPSTLAKMRNEAHRLEKNIANLLTMLELEVIEDESLVPINLSHVIQQELVTFQAIEPQRQVSLDIEQDLWIKGSDELVLKLLRNILSNIRRHSGSNSPVRMSLSRQGAVVELVVEDGGPLEVSQSMDIDNYLTRFSSSRSVSKGGSGLGFSIMKKSMNKLSGDLSLFRSELGGFGIRVRLPFHDRINS